MQSHNPSFLISISGKNMANLKKKIVEIGGYNYQKHNKLQMLPNIPQKWVKRVLKIFSEKVRQGNSPFHPQEVN